MYLVATTLDRAAYHTKREAAQEDNKKAVVPHRLLAKEFLNIS